MSTFTQTNTNANANTTGKRPNRTTEERKAKAKRAQAWNGKQKHGSYARHRQVIATAAASRQSFRDAEAAGEFVCVHRGNKSKSKFTAVSPTMPRILSRFAALANNDSADEESSQLPVITTPTEPTPVTPKPVTWGPSNKSAPVAPTKATPPTKALPSAPMKRLGLKNGSWADECDSDDED